MTNIIDEMPEIPRPQILDPQRVDRDDREDLTLEDHRSRAQLLGGALDESCGYATQLWNITAAMRSYLHAHTPGDPGDEPAWTAWEQAYANVVSVLCSAHGDSGFAQSQARLIAQDRRAT